MKTLLLALALTLNSIAHAEEPYSYNIKLDIKQIDKKGNQGYFDLTFSVPGTQRVTSSKTIINKTGDLYKADLPPDVQRKILSALFGEGIVVDRITSGYVSFNEKALKHGELSMELISVLNGVNGNKNLKDKDTKSFMLSGFSFPPPVLPPVVPEPKTNSIYIQADFNFNDDNIDHPGAHGSKPKDIVIKAVNILCKTAEDFRGNYIVYGYASPDNPSQKDADQKLSERRAQAVVSLLRSSNFKGLKFSGNVIAKGMGQTIKFSDPKKIDAWKKLLQTKGTSPDALAKAKEAALSPNRAIVIEKVN